MATANKVIKIFRQPVSALGTLETEIQNWLTMMDSSKYLIQSMAQSTDVVTEWGSPNVDVPYVTITLMAMRLPTA
jgi:hypothetical protein